MIQVNNYFFSIHWPLIMSELRITDMIDFMFDETTKKEPPIW